ncbi:glycoside hydrolase family 31 protein [Sediminitomix flava]|uniref:Oligosaccharide 4-alpha-D-glucosyltransferase n=1 Tax=Sediminitomix flava TaxID=379075 RepID=A0A315Z8K4_SEDFL|nr:TIM-barrel domain-containing protein [Sediminitomix flava]PWJ40769.1 oligosaccharide 4-alpha-D-glucosyltransferase [Sediminitomix flava]
MKINKESKFGFALIMALVFSMGINVFAQTNNSYEEHSLEPNALKIMTTNGKVTITVHQEDVMEVFYEQDSMKQLPSFAVDHTPKGTEITFYDKGSYLEYATPGLKAVIQKSPFQISYEYKGNPILKEEKGFVNTDSSRVFRFKLDDNEKLLGGGERVLGMDVRGNRLPLYNRAHYGYTTESNQMYFGIPALVSTKKYIVLFDNSAAGFMDVASEEENILHFEAEGGRTSYLVMAGDTYPDLISNYTDITGKQPLPPRWAFGNYASRFGYHTEQEAREVVAKFKEEDFPLDAIIFDLYWFGKEIQGNMGTLDWDKNAFPTPENMISDFKEEGVNTILITEPFILTTSKRWDDAVAKGVLALDSTDNPIEFDFFFGHTGLVDVFLPEGKDWFWNIYEGLMGQGVEGWWGDLGEPEVHPKEAIHAIGTANEVHNAYGHEWAKLVFENHRKVYPEKRPFIMMRSGFAGSQRYGMIPWTGDVSRSWGGLKPQVQLSLSMSLLGMSYTHSDLGGFAGGGEFDAEMYTRWLQYGVFQPVYRPHAQEEIAPEPIFHDEKTKDIVRKFVKLRYRLLPYIYTIAYDNSVTGMPLMRPLFFEDETNMDLVDYKDAYLWGDDFLVAPIVSAGVKQKDVVFPKGVWFDFWTGERYEGGQKHTVAVNYETIPVFVRAGAFIPMIDDIMSTKDYSSEDLTIHFYADESVKSSKSKMYEDDGKTFDARSKGLYEMLGFSSKQTEEGLNIELARGARSYDGMPNTRSITIEVHNFDKDLKKASFNSLKLKHTDSQKKFDKMSKGILVNEETKTLTIKFEWDHQPLKIELQ